MMKLIDIKIDIFLIRPRTRAAIISLFFYVKTFFALLKDKI